MSYRSTTCVPTKLLPATVRPGASVQIARVMFSLVYFISPPPDWTCCVESYRHPLKSRFFIPVSPPPLSWWPLARVPGSLAPRQVVGCMRGAAWRNAQPTTTLDHSSKTQYKAIAVCLLKGKFSCWRMWGATDWFVQTVSGNRRPHCYSGKWVSFISVRWMNL